MNFYQEGGISEFTWHCLMWFYRIGIAWRAIPILYQNDINAVPEALRDILAFPFARLPRKVKNACALFFYFVVLHLIVCMEVTNYHPMIIFYWLLTSVIYTIINAFYSVITNREIGEPLDKVEDTKKSE